ncbi:MAG TPA: histidine kinase [Nocardioidaceae bacterium]|nr:histidine kinase [Nocardioidaceae bacterium]
MGRLSLATRVFCLAAILGLALAVPELEQSRVTFQAVILLAAIGGTAIAADVTLRLPQSWVALTEGTLAALVIAFSLPDGFVLLPYLVIPAFIAGVSAGIWPVAAVVSAETAAMSLLLILSAGGFDALSEQARDVAPWLVTSLGVGAMGAWSRQVRYPGVPDTDPNYESARRLLTQLRTVARRLSSGLDSVSMCTQLLVTVNQHLADTHSAVFIRTEGGVLAPFGYRGVAAREALTPEGAVVDACWAEMEPAHAIQQSGQANRRHRFALPLRVGSRMIGLVLADGPQPVAPKVLQALMREVDEHALRIDTALTFDEVRSLATIEERQRLAREIHDGVAQEIASLGYVVDDLAATSIDENQRARLNNLRGEITRVVSELRLSIFDLRSEISPTAGLGSALSDYVRSIGARSGMTVHLTLDESPTRLRSEVETELLRIAQEAITNARKHAAAKNLWVDCRIHPPYAAITVTDDGAGLGAGRADSYGLKIMRERADRINATLDISAQEANGVPAGTTVAVTVGESPPV